MRTIPLLYFATFVFLSSCNGCFPPADQSSSGTTIVTETPLELKEGEVALTQCEVLVIDILRSSSFYKEYFGDKMGVFVGFSNNDSVRAGTHHYYAISVSDNNHAYPYELTFELETLVLTLDRDDRQRPITYDPALKKRFQSECLEEK